ncbi:MAG: hypothetical protein AB8B85_12430 [Paracoccaceae bacterium]
MAKALRVTHNIDLPDDVFAFIAIQHEDNRDQKPAVRLCDLREAAPEPDDTPVELVSFFARRCHVSPDAADPMLEGMESMLGSLGVGGLRDRVRRVTLVDCGDELMAPLSDLSVLGQVVEAVRAIVPPETEVRIFAADYTMDDERDAQFVLRDTRCETFVTHVANYTRTAMQVLNTLFEPPDQTQFGAANREQINARLAMMTSN